MSNRRTFIQKAFGLGAGLFAAPRVFADSPNGPSSRGRSTHASPAFNMPVVTADIGDLPHTMDGNTKVFHLIAEVVKQQIGPLKTIDAWGFNVNAPGPTIQVVQGDHVRVISRIGYRSQRRCTGTALKTPYKTTACPASARTR
jgi:manganese oxidase